MSMKSKSLIEYRDSLHIWGAVFYYIIYRRFCLKRFIILFIFCGIVYSKNLTTISANNVAVTTENGYIKYETIDTKATTGIRWETVGFTITREKCLSGEYKNGGCPLKLEHAIIFLKDEWKVELVTSNAVYVTFTIPQSVVSTAFIKAGFDEIHNNDELYLHGIFQVTHNGVNYGTKKYDLPAITNAESWANPDDFRDRFDIKVIYKAPDEPISIQYKTVAGDVIDTETYSKQKWVKPGTEVSVFLAAEKTYQGNKYKLYKSYIRYYTLQTPIQGYGKNTLNGDSFASVQKRTIKQRVGGVQFVAIMKLVKEVKPVSEKNILSKRASPMPYGVIAADERGNSFYEVESGIPATESLYLNVFSQDCLFGYEFENVIGEKEYQIKFTKTYHLKWTDVDYDENLEEITKERSTTKTVTKIITVKRKYSYWKLVDLEYYTIKEARIKNGALENGSCLLTPKEYYPPDLIYEHYTEETNYLKDPEYPKMVMLSAETIVGGENCPEVPDEDFESIAEEKIEEIQVRNDKLSLGTNKISDNTWKEKETTKPILLEREEEIREDVLYQSGLVIPKDTPNEVFQTEGTITYEAKELLGFSAPKSLVFSIAELGQVTVHTPTVCDAYVSDERAYNQMLSPDKTCTALVLDRTFQLHIPTEGEHLYIQGYGYRDYGKYIETRQVRFPFDVYQGKNYYRANTCITINSDTTSFYIPIWVTEGKYKVSCKSISISAAGNEGENKEEEFANLQLENYTATCQIPVEVSGRIFGFQITDITDYPTWYSVFRKENSLKPSGISYSVGVRNENGIPIKDTNQFTIPLIKGSHPTDAQQGIVPTGYAFRFTIQTIGEMYQEEDYVQLTPTFYYISKETQERMEADLYYMETINDVKYAFVKVGSELDLKNIKKRYLGNPYLSVPEEELNEKETLIGTGMQAIKYQLSPMFTFHHILLSEKFRTYVGRNHTPTGKIPAGVNEKKAAMSKQKWYGEYYLPSQLYVVPKDFDLAGYEQEHGGFHFRENFWLKNGYIMVQFDVKTVNDGKIYLSYRNQENAKYGYCNMWKKEGFSYEKTDTDGVKWKLEDGDTFLYDTDKRVGLDYLSGGTH